MLLFVIALSDGVRITGADGATESSVVLTVFDARLPFVAASNAEFAGSVIELGPSPSVTCTV